MPSIDLTRIKLGVSPITGQIYLFREGKEKGVALDTRPAEKDLFSALVQFMCLNSAQGSSKLVSWGDEHCYRVVVQKIPAEEYAEEKALRAAQALKGDENAPVDKSDPV